MTEDQELEYELEQVEKEASHVMRGFQVVQSFRVVPFLLFVLVDELILTEVNVEIPYLIVDSAEGWLDHRPNELDDHDEQVVLEVVQILLTQHSHPLLFLFVDVTVLPEQRTHWLELVSLLLQSLEIRLGFQFEQTAQCEKGALQVLRALMRDYFEEFAEVHEQLGHFLGGDDGVRAVHEFSHLHQQFLFVVVEQHLRQDVIDHEVAFRLLICQ